MKVASPYRHFDKATDSRYMKNFFARHLLPSLGSRARIDVFIPRVFIRHGTHFIIQYVIRDAAKDGTTGSERIMCGYLPVLGADTSRPLDPAQTLSDAATGLKIPRFPYDPDLPQLARWVNASWAAQQLDALLDPPLSVGAKRPTVIEDIEVLAYRLSRRCTLGITSSVGTGGIVAKIMRRRALEQALTADAHLRSATSDGFGAIGHALPRLLGSSRERGVLLMERAPGRSLHDLWKGAQCREACEAAGRLLASFHSLTPGEGPARTPQGEWAALTARMQLICTIFPDLLSVWEKARAPMENHMPKPCPEVAQIHGDFYDKQFLYSRGGTTLLDYDTLGRGDPALDVGNFLAHAELRKLQDPDSAASIETGVAVFGRAYSESGAGRPETARWWKAMTLTRLAGLYALRPRWRQLSQSLLAAAVQTTETVENHV